MTQGPAHGLRVAFADEPAVMEHENALAQAQDDLHQVLDQRW